jgi:hypothetical protein
VKAGLSFWSKFLRDFGDTIIQTKKLQPDSIHPTTNGYKELANQTK